MPTLIERTKAFIKESKQTHGTQFDYSKVNYKGMRTPVEIHCLVCKQAGREYIIHQRPVDHTRRKRACERCWEAEKNEKALKQITSSRYDLSQVRVRREKVKSQWRVVVENIFCPTHNTYFEQRIEQLKEGRAGCKVCYQQELSSLNKRRQKKSIPQRYQRFLKQAKEAHEDKYDYSKVQYKQKHKKILIGCKTCGHWFKQSAHAHTSGSGCPKCFHKKNVTQEVFEKILKREVKGVKILSNYKPKWLQNPATKQRLELDLFLPTLNLAFEVQGQQHYKAVEFWGGEKALKSQKKRDALKVRLCKKRGVRLIPFDIRTIKKKSQRHAVIQRFVRKALQEINVSMALLWVGNTTVEHYEPSPLEGAETLEESPWNSITPSWLKSID